MCDLLVNNGHLRVNRLMIFFQVDFMQTAHITEIEVQGYDGDTAKYVTKYHIQWSDDADFWHHLHDEVTV